MNQDSVVRRVSVVMALITLVGVSANGQPQQAIDASRTATQRATSAGQVSTDSGARFRSGVDLVPLDVCVRDAAGGFINDLTAEDFLVLENGKPQQLSLLIPSGAVPLNVALLIDISQSMHGAKLSRALEAATLFGASSRVGDRLEVIAFNGRALRLHGFDEEAPLEAATLTASIDAARTSIGSSGSTALYDALLVAINDLVRLRRGPLTDARDVVILLSDGEDTSSRVGFDEVLPVVRRSGVLVYSVSLRATAKGEWLGANWPLLQLARDTGARTLGVPRLEALPELYREIDAEVRHLYRLAYVSSDRTRDGRWRTISVRVPSRNARAFTRSGYYAPRGAGRGF